MGRKLCQNKNRHLAKIMNNLDEMKREGDQCDFTIKVGIVEYRGHKNILSAGSEYFKAMFRHSMKENQHGVVEMKDMDSECLQSCIDFIYTGELEIPDGKSSELLHASQILQLDDARDAVIEELVINLSVENLFPTQKIAKLYDLKGLFLKCKEFEKNIIIDISSQPNFQSEEKMTISQIFCSDDLVISDKEKLNIAISWVGERVERKDDFLEILDLIDLTHVPPDYLKNLIDNDPLISNDLILYKTFNNARTENLGRSLTDSTKKKKCGEKSIELKSDDGEKLMFFNVNAGCLQIVDPGTNETKILSETKFRDLSCPSMTFAVTSLNSFIYILCPSNSVHRLNFKDPNPRWEKMPDTIENHGWSPPAVSTLDFVFVIGGTSSLSLQPSNVVERFDSTALQWSRLMDAPSPVSDHAMVSFDETIYCLGGRFNDGISNAFRAFNVSSSQWTDLPPMTNARESCCAVVVNRSIFAFGGWRNHEWLNEVEFFEIMTSQWSTITQTNERVVLPCACLIGDWIFIGSQGGSTDEIVKYNVKNDRWQRVTGFPSFKWKYFVGI